ncbi:hypothetical protein SEA_VANLEE_71 [Gordonia phage VanLee]|uniref:Uncharacterized protein n=1 Tax=Gordonia phage VanLee TaxID=2845816 RepID=A0A8F2D9P7_9CAUD|nr:hypothetical protein QEH49_gp071 [Gordonia phage VanLee]QWS68188.1 hypothetical protein SEA_VANLEE_71 [Gordonia phage VanLee]
MANEPNITTTVSVQMGGPGIGPTIEEMAVFVDRATQMFDPARARVAMSSTDSQREGASWTLMVRDTQR